jgi:hypothetical protein
VQQIIWHPQDAAATREFFNSETGQKALTILQNSIKMETGKTNEEEALNYRFTKGQIYLLQQIVKLTEEKDEEPENVLEFQSPPNDGRN